VNLRAAEKKEDTPGKKKTPSKPVGGDFKLRGDDDEGEVDGKPRAEEDEQHEKGPDPERIAVLHGKHDGRPALERDDLKHAVKGRKNIVKGRDAAMKLNVAWVTGED
jgi:hypothetical protein